MSILEDISAELETVKKSIALLNKNITELIVLIKDKKNRERY
jgi:hypothetical protein